MMFTIIVSTINGFSGKWTHVKILYIWRKIGFKKTNIFGKFLYILFRKSGQKIVGII